MNAFRVAALPFAAMLDVVTLPARAVYLLAVLTLGH